MKEGVVFFVVFIGNVLKLICKRMDIELVFLEIIGFCLWVSEVG